MSITKSEDTNFENLGAIIVEGLEQASFWIRAFKLEKQIDFVRNKINEKPSRKVASVPIIGHYKVDDKFTFHYTLSFEVDSIGVQHVFGKIWFCSPEHTDKVVEAWHGIGDFIMESIHNRVKHSADELIPFEVDTEIFEPSSEKEIE